MHPKLSKPPVTYVLAQIKFSIIENIASYIPQLQDKIRDIFPHYQEVNVQTVQLRGGQQPLNAAILTQWHFIDKEKYTGIILDKQSITIHTSRYEQFQPLLNILEQVVTRFHKILKLVLFTQLGLRYINCIEDGLDNMDPGLLGFQLTDGEFRKNQFLMKTEITQLSQEGVVKIQATHVGDKKVIGSMQNILVPPDLASIANLLSFKPHSEPQQGFLILDLDHFSSIQGDFDIKEILNRLHRLQEVVYRVFCQAVGKTNLQAWE